LVVVTKGARSKNVVPRGSTSSSLFTFEDNNLVAVGDNGSVAVKNNESVVGGTKDGYGCSTAAGYVWCNSTQSCTRTWEKPCPTITAGCVVWFDGCNKSLVLTAGVLGDCTRKACPSLEESCCAKFRENGSSGANVSDRARVSRPCNKSSITNGTRRTNVGSNKSSITNGTKMTNAGRSVNASTRTNSSMSLTLPLKTMIM